MSLVEVIYTPKLFVLGYAIVSSASQDETALYNSIIHAYTQQHRVYHTIAHVEALGKNYFDWCVLTLQEPTREMCLAILYHDIVYDPYSYSNEEMSADLFARHADALNIPEYLQDIVEDLILSTQHSTDEGRSHSRLTDLDLLILAASEEVYENYAKAVRQEYKAVPDVDYCAARVKFLMSLLDRKSIYLDQHINSMNESRARSNIMREVTVLERDVTVFATWDAVIDVSLV